jgi:hypothetical protein
VKALMLKDKQGESVYDYVSRFAPSTFKAEIDRKLVQHSINKNLSNFPFEGTRLLPLLLEELANKYI